MMPPTATSTLELIARYYATFNQTSQIPGDRSAFLALLTADVVHDLNQGEREIGHAAFTRFLARMDRCYREQIRDLTFTVAPDGTRAAAEYVVHGTYIAQDDGLPPATGQRYVLPGGAFFDVRSGKIARVTNCYNLNDWLRQISVG